VRCYNRRAVSDDEVRDIVLRNTAARLARHGYILATLAIIVSTALFLPGRSDFAKGQWALFYLLIILLVASAAGTGPAVLAAVLAFLAWNFFFLPPYHTLFIRDPQDWISLVAFLVVGVIVGIQAGRMREREARAVAREHETAALNRLSAELVSQASTETMARAVLSEVVGLLGAASANLFVAESDGLHNYGASPPGSPGSAVAERAKWAFTHNEPLGVPGTASSRRTPAEAPAFQAVGDAGGMYLPLRSPSGASGVLTVAARTDGREYSAVDARLVASLANLVGVFLERQHLQAAATQAEAGREADRLKSSLLSSVSHELKTPLAALTATVSNLLESDVDWDEASVRDELRAIVGDVTRLNNSIGALLDLSRLEANAWEPRRELYDLAEIVAAGTDALPAHERARIRLDLPQEAPVIDVDFGQWVRVVQNLLENALLYAGGEAPVTVGARETHRAVRIWVEDEGPGVAVDEHEAVFDKFYRGRGTGAKAPSGTGLGLAITREIVHAHGGSIHVEDVKPRGARFVIVLPTNAGASKAEETAK
jgi:two-component system, OmpR family, sensor histidine kinase KdpD